MSQVLEEKRDEMRCESSTLSCSYGSPAHTFYNVCVLYATIQYIFADVAFGWKPRISAASEHKQNGEFSRMLKTSANLGWTFAYVGRKSIKLNDVTERIGPLAVR